MAESHERSHYFGLKCLYFTIKASDFHFCFMSFNLGKNDFYAYIYAHCSILNYFSTLMRKAAE